MNKKQTNISLRYRTNKRTVDRIFLELNYLSSLNRFVNEKVNNIKLLNKNESVEDTTEKQEYKTVISKAFYQMNKAILLPLIFVVFSLTLFPSLFDLKVIFFTILNDSSNYNTLFQNNQNYLLFLNIILPMFGVSLLILLLTIHHSLNYNIKKRFLSPLGDIITGFYNLDFLYYIPAFRQKILVKRRINHNKFLIKKTRNEIRKSLIKIDNRKNKLEIKINDIFNSLKEKNINTINIRQNS